MKKIALVFFFTLSYWVVNAQNFILPKQFIFHQQDEMSFVVFPNATIPPDLIQKLVFFEGGKKKSGTAISIKDLSKKADEKGLMLLGIDLKTSTLAQNKDSVVRFFEGQNFLFLADTLKKSFQSKVPKLNIHSFQKVLFLSERGFGNLFSQKIGQDLEIILLQNPYFALYGEDITGVLLYKGEPVRYHTVKLSNISSHHELKEILNTSTDDKGQFYFKTNRLGIWHIEAYHWDAKKSPDVIEHALYNFEFVK